MPKFLMVLLVISALTACNKPIISPLGRPPMPMQNGSPAYQKGVKDGCETGMQTYGNMVIRMAHRTNINPYMMENPEYHRGWEVANKYCRYHARAYGNNITDAFKPQNVFWGKNTLMGGITEKDRLLFELDHDYLESMGRW